jgi:hypothetical protein
MLEQLVSRPNPLLYFAVVFPLSLLAVWIGYRYASRDPADDEKSGWAFGLTQGAIFGLIVLVLGFSFSSAASKFEARRDLVVSETDAIRTAYLRAGFLPGAKAARFRALLIDYTSNRLQTYADVGDARAERRSLGNGDRLQRQLWDMATLTARLETRSPFVADLTRSVIDITDVSEQQEAALSNHVPRTVIGIVLLSTIIGAVLLGLTFGYAKSPNVLLAVLFCLLFSATVFTIIDLDHPQGGFVAVDIAPLQSSLEDMTSGRDARIVRGSGAR